MVPIEFELNVAHACLQNYRLHNGVGVSVNTREFEIQAGASAVRCRKTQCRTRHVDSAVSQFPSKLQVKKLRNPSISWRRVKRMRAVVQRVLSAAVSGMSVVSNTKSRSYSYLLISFTPVDDEVVSQISRGLMVLVGIGIGLSALEAVLHSVGECAG